MKNQILFLFLACFFAVNLSFGSIDSGVIILPVINGKTGATTTQIVVPDKFLDKASQLTYPLEFYVYRGKTIVHKGIGTELGIQLPTGLEGIFLIEVKISEFTVIEKIQL